MIFRSYKRLNIIAANYSERSPFVHHYSHSYQESLQMSLTRIRNSLGLQQFQLGIITEDSLGQVSQLVVVQVPIKITLETCKVHAEYNRYDKNDT